MIAAFLRISHKFEQKPLIFPVIYKALFFTLFVMLFDIIEMLIRGLIHNPVLTEVFDELKNHISYVWLGAALLIFCSFVPFFSIKELSRIMGEEKIRSLFFRKRKEQPE
jgi:hypothetical protein